MAAPESPTPRPSTVPPVPLIDVARLLDRPVDADRGRLSITGVSLASDSVRAGDLYAALPGTRTHGARYVDRAVAAGAIAVMTDADGATFLGDAGSVEVPVLVVDRPRALLGEVAALVYGRPAEAITLVGVTGTHGKTTTTQLIAHAAARAGRTTAVVGTMGTWIAGERVGSALTTPEAPDLHALFAVMREQEVEVCAIEVSSHALVMGRVDGVVFDLAVFTNLGRDHLDFHRDMEEYFAAKAQLFTPARATAALVNVDDSYGRRLAERAEVPTRTLTIGAVAADWHAAMDVASSGPEATVFVVSGPDGVERRGSVAMPGEFNVSNALAAIAVCTEVGLDLDAAIDGVAAAPPVGGRMERVDADPDVAVIVDYAHKPDALRAVLAALRPVTPGRLILVVGAGGDRDRGKRPIMGEVGAASADLLVVTDDNPRSEEPASIRAEIVEGARGSSATAEVVEVGDRREAIRYAVATAQPGDTVLIAGKGHETGQEVGTTVLPFDDRAEARAAIAERSEAAP